MKINTISNRDNIHFNADLHVLNKSEDFGDDFYKQLKQMTQSKGYNSSVIIMSDNMVNKEVFGTSGAPYTDRNVNFDYFEKGELFSPKSSLISKGNKTINEFKEAIVQGLESLVKII